MSFLTVFFHTSQGDMICKVKKYTIHSIYIASPCTSKKWLASPKGLGSSPWHYCSWLVIYKSRNFHIKCNMTKTIYYLGGLPKWVHHPIVTTNFPIGICFPCFDRTTKNPRITNILELLLLQMVEILYHMILDLKLITLLLMEEIRRSPVEVGSLSEFLPLFIGFYTSKRWLNFPGFLVAITMDPMSSLGPPVPGQLGDPSETVISIGTSSFIPFFSLIWKNPTEKKTQNQLPRYHPWGWKMKNVTSFFGEAFPNYSTLFHPRRQVRSPKWSASVPHVVTLETGLSNDQQK